MKKFITTLLLSIITIISFLGVYIFFLWEDVKTNKLNTTFQLLDDYFLYNWLLKEIWNDIIILRIDDKTVDDLQTNDTNIFTMTKSTHAQIIENLFQKYKIGVLWIDIIYGRKWEKKDVENLKNTLEKYSDKIVIWTQPIWLKPLCEYQEIQQWMTKVINEVKIRKIKINFNDYKNWCNTVDKWVQALGIEIFKQYIKKADLFQKYELFKKYSKNKIYENNINSFIEEYSKKENELNSLIINNIIEEWINNKIYFSFHKVKDKQILKDGVYWFNSYSIYDIYRGNELNEDWEKIDLEWKIVLIWEVWTSFHDEYFSPINLENKIPWVEFHANIIATLLNNNLLYKINTSIIVLLMTIFSIILILTYFTKFKYSIILLSWYIFFNIFLWKLLINYSWEFIFWIKEKFYIYPVSFFIFYWIVFFIIIYVYKYIEEIIKKNLYLKKYDLAIKDKDFIKRAFWQYISPSMVDAIIKDPNKLKLWWEKKELTMFFSDLVWFTSISEAMDSKSLFTFLNIYFEEMWRILIKNSGTIDKYIWDALMWFFWAPLHVENSEYKACITALEQIEKLKEINTTFKKIKKDFPTFEMRVWINTWMTSHGNLWWKNNINYTVIWDSVNLASRLESVNKQYGSKICISESTYIKVKNNFIFRELDTIRVKWKNISIKIYELIWNVWEVADITFIKNYEDWLQLYYKWKYDNAIMYFEKNALDEPSKRMLDRCKDFKINNKKQENWIFTMTNK